MKTIILFFSILLTGSISAQFTVYTMANSGLSNDFAGTLAENADGLWIGTLSGLNLFDGTNWTTLNTSNSDLPHSTVTELTVDSGGYLWLWNFNVGCSWYDGTTFHTFNTSDGLGSNSGSNIMWLDGNIWAGTDGGLSINDGGVWTNYSTANSDIPHNDVRDCDVDDQGNWWVPTFGGGVGYYNGNWTTYDVGNSDLPDNQVFNVLVHDDGHVWIGTRNGLVDFDNGNMIIYDSNNSPLVDDDIRDLVFCDNGDLVIATRFSGVYILSTNGNWTEYNTSNSNIPSDDVFDVLIDSNGLLWVGTANGLGSIDNYCSPNAVEELSALQEAEVYFAYDILNVSIPSEKAEVLVYDLMGRMVWRSNTMVSSLSEDLSVLSVGIYEISLISETERRTWKVFKD